MTNRKHIKFGRLRFNHYLEQKGYFPPTLGITFYDWKRQPTLDIFIGMNIYSICWVRKEKTEGENK